MKSGHAALLGAAVVVALAGCPGAFEAPSNSPDGGAGADGSRSDGEPPTSGGGSDARTEPLPEDPAAYRGRILISESFDDGNLNGRGWYDGGGAGYTTAENAPGSTGGAYGCVWNQGQSSCVAGRPGRVKFDGVEAVYFSVKVKHTANWVGSGRAYHPHLFHFLTNLDADYQGPSYSHLTTYIEHVNGIALLGVQDSANVDTGCIRLNNGSWQGCDPASYDFGEARSVAACNGQDGDYDSTDCFPWGDGTWYSFRGWRSDEIVFADQAGPRFKGDWHTIEAYFGLNSVAGGVGQADGILRYWIDGQLVIASDQALFRTGQHPEMRFDQVAILPYIGDGSPVNQTMWFDDVVVAEGNQ